MECHSGNKDTHNADLKGDLSCLGFLGWSAGVALEHNTPVSVRTPELAGNEKVGGPKENLASQAHVCSVALD